MNLTDKKSFRKKSRRRGDVNTRHGSYHTEIYWHASESSSGNVSCVTTCDKTATDIAANLFLLKEKTKWWTRKGFGSVWGSKNIIRSLFHLPKLYLEEPSCYPVVIFRRQFAIPCIIYSKLRSSVLDIKPNNWKLLRCETSNLDIPTYVKILARLPSL